MLAKLAPIPLLFPGVPTKLFLSMSRFYFAYGSNLDAAQMERRCPGSQYRGKAFLPKHRMAFTHPSTT